MKKADYDRLMRLHPLDRAKKLGGLIAEHQRETTRLATLRAQAIAELRRDGMSLEEIGAELGVTRQQIHRLARRGV